MIDSKNLVLRVNELFHDFEGKLYQKKHIDIFKCERNRWKKASRKYIANHSRAVTVLDIGTGTGFIPLTIAPFLKKGDHIICSDISSEMLHIVEQNIEKEDFSCSFSFLKTDGVKIDVKQVDVVTMNSVLHHIPDLSNFFQSISPKVVDGGKIIIGHEPNQAFYQNRKLLFLYLFFSNLWSFKVLILNIVRTLKINILIKKVIGTKIPKPEFVRYINKRLIDEKLVEQELSVLEINKLVDYHSPSSGAKIDRTKGIDIKELQKKYLPGFEIEYYETYNFISKMSDKNLVMKKLNRYLSKKYKDMGATFFVVLKKSANDYSYFF